MRETLKRPSLHNQRVAHDVKYLLQDQENLSQHLVDSRLPAVIKPSLIHPTKLLHVKAALSDALR